MTRFPTISLLLNGRFSSYPALVAAQWVVHRGECSMKQRAAEEYTQIDQGSWAPFPDTLSVGGIRWKLLHVSPEAGTWTAIFECPAGSSFNAHIHTGPGEYFLYKGKMEVRGGDD